MTNEFLSRKHQVGCVLARTPAVHARAYKAAYVPPKARNVHVNVRIESMLSEPMLLPVWIKAYCYRDRLFRFLLNGQTGQATGQAPVSLKKIFVAVAIAVVVILLLLLCAGVLDPALSDTTDLQNAADVQIATVGPADKQLPGWGGGQSHFPCGKIGTVPELFFGRPYAIPSAYCPLP